MCVSGLVMWYGNFVGAIGSLFERLEGFTTASSLGWSQPIVRRGVSCYEGPGTTALRVWPSLHFFIFFFFLLFHSPPANKPHNIIESCSEISPTKIQNFQLYKIIKIKEILLKLINDFSIWYFIFFKWLRYSGLDSKYSMINYTHYYTIFLCMHSSWFFFFIYKKKIICVRAYFNLGSFDVPWMVRKLYIVCIYVCVYVRVYLMSMLSSIVLEMRNHHIHP